MQYFCPVCHDMFDLKQMKLNEDKNRYECKPCFGKEPQPMPKMREPNEQR